MVTVYYGTERIRLTITSQRSLVIYHNDGSSGWYTVGSLARSTLLSSTVITLLVKNGTWTVRGDGGAELTAARAVGTVTNLPMSGVEVDAGAGARIAGVQISHPTSSAREFASIGFTPSMRFTPSGGLASTMDMSPAIRGRQVGDLVDEILKATLTAAWWDTEGGVLRLVPLGPAARRHGSSDHHDCRRHHSPVVGGLAPRCPLQRRGDVEGPSHLQGQGVAARAVASGQGCPDGC